MSMSRVIGLLAIVIAVLPGVVLADEAKEAKKAAVFPFELVIERQSTDGIMPPSANDDEKKRLRLMTERLGSILQESGKFSLVDLSSHAAAIEKASPVHDCNGCDLDLAREAGAQVSVVGVVRKASNALINISVFVRDVADGKVVRVGAVSIRENNEAGWLRAVRSIARNRLLREPR